RLPLSRVAFSASGARRPPGSGEGLASTVGSKPSPGEGYIPAVGTTTSGAVSGRRARRDGATASVPSRRRHRPQQDMSPRFSLLRAATRALAPPAPGSLAFWPATHRRRASDLLFVRR